MCHCFPGRGRAIRLELEGSGDGGLGVPFLRMPGAVREGGGRGFGGEVLVGDMYCDMGFGL